MSKQEKDGSTEALAKRLRRFQVSEGMTWLEVAKKLGVSLSMVMMVLRGDRRLSAKALHRLEKAEKEVVQRKSGAETVVDGLLNDQGSAKELVRRAGKGGTQEVPVEYKPSRGKKSLPAQVILRRPPRVGCVKLHQLFAETMDTKMVLLACLPDTLRSEGFLGKLTADSRISITNAALNLVMPDWRNVVASAATAN